jgi:hypothetical protein
MQAIIVFALMFTAPELSFLLITCLILIAESSASQYFFIGEKSYLLVIRPICR